MPDAFHYSVTAFLCCWIVAVTAFFCWEAWLNRPRRGVAWEIEIDGQRFRYEARTVRELVAVIELTRQQAAEAAKKR